MMKMPDQQHVGQAGAPAALGRGAFLRSVAAMGTGLAIASAAPERLWAASPRRATDCAESVQDIIDAALTAERLAVTFYYQGLTSRSIVSDTRVAGSSANINAVAADGSPENVAYLRAALDQEFEHAQILAAAGARSPYHQFYFPDASFEQLGFTNHVGTYLWVLDHLETAFIGAYIAAMKRLAALGHPDLAVLAVRILGVESQHRALYRAISVDDPADNVTLEVAEFACVGDAVDVLKPFLTGQGFPSHATPAIPMPTQEQTVRVIGPFRGA